jgi:hypothetical protein
MNLWPPGSVVDGKARSRGRGKILQMRIIHERRLDAVT